MQQYFHSISAMQNEHKVVRLQRQVIHVNYSYLLDEVAPDALVPHLVARRLLTPEEAKEVKGKSDREQKGRSPSCRHYLIRMLWECSPHSGQPFAIQGYQMLQKTL